MIPHEKENTIMKKMLAFLMMTLLVLTMAVPAVAEETPIEIKVLILPKFESGEMAGDFPGEAQYYYEAYCAGGEEYEIAGAFEGNKLYVKDGVALHLTGMGKVNAAMSLHALLMDDRFDFSNAYVLSTGCAGSAYETTVTGNTAEYSFSNVASGTYVLQVQKEGHVTREYDVTVVALSVTRDVTICPRGDVAGDGKVNIMDVVKLYAHVKGTPITDAYALACGDVTGDNKANIMDVVKVYAYVKGVAFL